MIQVCKYAHLFKYASMQVCKHLSMKVCKYARGHLALEQRGRVIGKGPLPKEKLMKALGEVSSHCEIFQHIIKKKYLNRQFYNKIANFIF